MKLTLGQFDVDAGLIHIEGRYQRSLTMASDLQQMLGGFIEPDSEEHLLWRKPDGHVQTQSDISKMIHYAALDSGFENAELVDLNSLRHTYLKHLAKQGVRLNLLEKFAGYITPTQLSQYRQLAESGMTTELSELEMIHPSLSAKRER
jgi:site-specific recombinase XerD